MATLLLFDIDGTLVLSGGAGVRAMTHAFHDTFQIDDGFSGVSMPGRTDPLIVADALARAGLTPDETTLSRFQHVYFSCLAREITQPGPRKGVLPGVRALLGRLSANREVVLALLSGNYAQAAKIKLEYFDLWNYFGCGAFGEDAADRHQLVGIAMARVVALRGQTFSLEDVVVIGDTPLDVACARDAGVRSVAVATGGFDRDVLMEAGATVVFEDLADTGAFLAAITKHV